MFNAYNQEGYYLSLLYNKNTDEMHITLNAPIPMDNFQIPQYAVEAGLPIPSSSMGYFKWQNTDSFLLYVGNTSKEDYFIYKNTCIAAGFTNDPYEYNTVYSAMNANGYKVSLNYEGFDVFTLEFRSPNANSDSSDNATEYTLDYNNAESFEIALNNGSKVKGKIVQFEVIEYKPDSAMGINCWSGERLNFISDEELDVGKGSVIIGRITDEPTNTLGSWIIHYEVLSISGDKVEEDSTESTDSDIQPTEITITMDEDDFKRMNYQEAEKIFREMGFTKFEYRTVSTETQSDEDTICYVEITELFIGNSDFVKGDKFDADSTITFFTYKYEEPATPSPVFYSTNDYETAKKGNTGVFSYIDKGNSYDIYWIIDFDEGYVYYFTDGNGESFCDRLKIESGTLNDKITITYHDGGDTWSYKLHFKYVEHPETLIMVDQNGFNWEYSTTDLDDALALRTTKKIKDY